VLGCLTVSTRESVFDTGVTDCETATIGFRAGVNGASKTRRAGVCSACGGHRAARDGQACAGTGSAGTGWAAGRREGCISCRATLIVNRRTRFRLHDALPDLVGAEAAGHRLYFGGPVGKTLLVMLLRNEKPGKTLDAITDEVSFSADREVLERLIARKKPEAELRLYLGHAGWGRGQLSHELARGDWHLTKADANSIFGEAEELWDRLIDDVDPPGFDVRRRSGEWLSSARIGATES